MRARKTSAQWVLEGDIRSCFDEIQRQWIEKNIPIPKKTLRKWLKAGYMNLSVNENLLAFHSFCIFLEADLLPLSHGQYVQISFQKFARNLVKTK
ncbi:MAG: hypothetical protein AAF443_06825, partial [Chlamydiota bacterium]